MLHTRFFISKYLHSVVDGRPPYHPPLGRHRFPGLWKKTSYAAFPGAALHALLQRMDAGARMNTTSHARRRRETRRTMFFSTGLGNGDDPMEGGRGVVRPQHCGGIY